MTAAAPAARSAMSRSQGVCNQPLAVTRTPRVNWLSILGEGRRPPFTFTSKGIELGYFGDCEKL